MDTKFDLKEYIENLVKRSRAAEEIFSVVSQEKADEVVKAIGKLFYYNAEEFSKAAREETNMGNFQSKINKHRKITFGHMAYLKDKKSVGLLDYDPVLQVATYAKPKGVVACVTPVTNPTVTIAGNGMCVFKCRNTMIVASHPSAVNCTKLAVNKARDAIKEIGLPEDIIQCIEYPSIEATSLLMELCDTTVATGGPGMVRSAYSSGKPALGVGQGNVQAVIDADCEDLYDWFAEATITNRSSDNGVPCTSEQCIHIPEVEADKIVKAFVAKGAYLIEDDERLDILRSNLFNKNPDGSDRINAAYVGKSAMELSEMFGLNVSEGTRILLCKARGTAWEEPLCREKLCPISAYLPYKTFEEGVEHALLNLKKEGAGHSSCIYSHNQEHIDMLSDKLPVCRVIVNGSTGNAGGNSFKVGLNPTISLGCGSWGGNSVSENITYYHFMNYTKVATFMPDAYEPTAEELFS